MFSGQIMPKQNNALCMSGVPYITKCQAISHEVIDASQK